MISIFLISAFIILCSAFLFAQTPYYHIERLFVPVDCDIEGTPTVADLYAESEDLTETVFGSQIVIDSNETYAIERQMAIPICYSYPEAAWIAALNYNWTPSNYPGKIFDNVGWVVGTKKTGGDWGAYIWILQNRIAFQSSTSSWWTTTNGLPIAITNVMVGTLGDYQPTNNIIDVGPYLDGVTNRYLGPGYSDDKVYRVDITNVCYQLWIPDIWITPRSAVTCVGGSNVQFMIYGTNIPKGVTWTIFQTNFEGHAVLQTNIDWHYASVTPGNVGTNYKIRATSSDNTNFYDQVDLTVLKIEKIPLGGSTNLNKYIIGKVYIPTKWGGSNTLSGTHVQLFYTDGMDLETDTAIQIAKGEMDGNLVAQGNPCVYEIPSGDFGWYYVKITNESDQMISSTFYEHGEVTRPWQGYYWSLASNTLPNLYQDGYALNKYDQVYGTTSQVWEAANHVSTNTADGHCWGTAVASVLTNQPAETTSNNDVEFSQDDMEGLYIELANCGAEPYATYSVTNIPASPVSEALGEAVDDYCDEFHTVLSQVIIEKNKPLVGDLRDPDGQNESVIWNHAIYKYESEMQQMPGQEDENIIRVKTWVWSPLTTTYPSTGSPPAQDRSDYYFYDIKYNMAGEINGSYTNQNWRYASGFPPESLFWLKCCLWTAQNPEVSLERIECVYGD